MQMRSGEEPWTRSLIWYTQRHGNIVPKEPSEQLSPDLIITTTVSNAYRVNHYRASRPSKPI